MRIAPSISVENIYKSFGKMNVLDGINLTIEPGKINFIIGQSGGGKSVLLKHLVGLLAPDSGKIFFDGNHLKNSTDWQKLRLQSALLFQNSALFDSMSVGENVCFPLRVHNIKPKKGFRAEAEIRLNEVGMPNVFDRWPSELSTGEKKRVALARALIIEPDVLFFDEPTTGLDPLLSTQIDNLILETSHKTKATIVVVSHDIAATLSLADKISMIYKGKIILSGTAEDFKNSPEPVIKQFLAGNSQGPMEFLD